MANTFTFFTKVARIEVRNIEFENRSTKNEMDAVWLDSTVTVQAGSFSESFRVSFTTDDLVSLHEQLKSALTTLSGTVFCQATGGGFSLAIKLDRCGKAAITGVAHPNRLRAGILHFRLDTDHFALIRTLRELEDTLQAFPTKQTNQEQRWS